MHYFKKIISCFVLFAIISPCVIVESKAVDYTSMSNFWTWSSQYTWGLGDQLLGMASDSVCTESEDEKHHASSYQYDAGDGYYRCVCQYCGETFRAYESDISSAYDDYVTDLQTDLGTTTLIDGGVRVYFNFPEPALCTTNAADVFEKVSNIGGINPSISGIVSHDNYDTGYIHLSYNSTYSASVTAPFLSYYRLGGDWTASSPNFVYTEPTAFAADLVAASAGTVINSVAVKWKIDDLNDDGKLVSLQAHQWVDFYYTSIPEFESIYFSVNSRPSSITGDYGIIGDDGSITKIDGDLIVDESSSTVYNPVTNTTHNYTDYAYDYSDRSYNLTLEDGSTMKVVYGDENVTIEEGDTVYNVYYLTSGSEGGSGSGGSGDDGSGGIGGAIGGLFDVLGEIIYGLIEGAINLATKALSALTGLLDLLKQFGESIVGFFGGYLDFLGAVFPFLPEETFTILNLGLILMIAAAVFKKFL